MTRPGLVALLDYARAGETVVVASLDRLGRSLSGVIRTVEALTEAGVLLRSLREGIDYSTATGRMLAGIFAALAGYEPELMHERAAAARARGRYTGRPPKLTATRPARSGRCAAGARRSPSSWPGSGSPGPPSTGPSTAPTPPEHGPHRDRARHVCHRWTFGYRDTDRRRLVEVEAVPEVAWRKLRCGGAGSAISPARTLRSPSRVE